MDIETEINELNVARFEVDELRLALHRAERRAARPLWRILGGPAVAATAGIGLVFVGAQHLVDGTPWDRAPILIGAAALYFALIVGYIRFDTRNLPQLDVAGLQHRLAAAVGRVNEIVEAGRASKKA